VSIAVSDYTLVIGNKNYSSWSLRPWLLMRQAYLAERHVKLELWPAASAARAVARSVSAEMHSGFQHLRTNMSMNCRGHFPGLGRTVEVAGEIDRIQRLWADCRARFSGAGPFLFGRFCIADAMYAPVVLRFRTYQVQLSPGCREYADAVLALPALQEWVAAAMAETELIAAFEPQPV
jgi:glutathione S-transferase